MEQNQILSSSLYDRIPPLSANHQWIVAQNLYAEDETQVQIFYSVHDPLRHYRCQIPELLGKHVEGCFYGWVIISDHSRNVKWSLWNPATSKVINFPLLFYKDIGYCCLTSPPDDPDSILLMTRAQKPHFVFCRLHPKKKKLRWTKMSYAKLVKKVTGEDGYLYYLTCCNGKVYACAQLTTAARTTLLELSIVVKGTGVTINLLSLLKFPNYGSLFDSRQYYLVGSCKDIFIIYIHLDNVTKTISDVQLFKLDMICKKWEELEDLKDATIILEFAGYLCPQFHSLAIGSDLGGYIHILSKIGEIIYSYHVKDKTISLSCARCLVGTSHVSSWAMPECTRLLEGDHKQEDDKKDMIVVSTVKSHEVQYGTTDESLLLNLPFDVLETFMAFWRRLCRLLKRLLEGDHKQEEDKKDKIVVSKVKSHEVQYGTTDESHLLNLPFEVLETIMAFCVGVEYMKFRASCKLCYLVAPIIQWSNQTVSKRLQWQEYSLVSPWLMVFGKHTITLFDPMFGDKYFIKTPQELGLISELKIHCSRYGWLLMENISGSFFFFNPFTSDTRMLPEFPYSDCFDFSAPPTSSDCIVVGFTSTYTGKVHIDTLGRDSSWRLTTLKDPHLYRFPTFYKGDVYTLRNGKGVDYFEGLGDGDHKMKRYRYPGEAPISSCTSKAQHFLVKCDKHLLVVIVGEFGESVEVFTPNEDDGTWKWDKIDDIGRHMIYIDDKTCLCMEAEIQIMENKIYFPRLHAGKIVFYSFETRKLHTFDGGNISGGFTDFSGTINHSPRTTAWIEPAWS